jgi:hypothetical protein
MALESGVRLLTYPPAVSVIQLIDGTAFIQGRERAHSK